MHSLLIEWDYNKKVLKKGDGNLKDALFLKYGGVKFIPLAGPEEINAFVAQLPEDKRNSLHAVAEQLGKAGLVSFPNDGQFVTIDTEMEPYLE